MDEKKMTEHPEQPPFQKHKLMYIVLKFAVIAAAAFIAVRFLALG